MPLLKLDCIDQSGSGRNEQCVFHSLTTKRDVLILVPRQCFVKLVK